MRRMCAVLGCAAALGCPRAIISRGRLVLQHTTPAVMAHGAFGVSAGDPFGSGFVCSCISLQHGGGRAALGLRLVPWVPLGGSRPPRRAGGASARACMAGMCHFRPVYYVSHPNTLRTSNTACPIPRACSQPSPGSHRLLRTPRTHPPDQTCACARPQNVSAVGPRTHGTTCGTHLQTSPERGAIADVPFTWMGVNRGQRASGVHACVANAHGECAWDRRGVSTNTR